MTIRAKFDSKCAACGGRVHKGDSIEWSRGNPARHTTCPENPEPAPERKPAQSHELDLTPDRVTTATAFYEGEAYMVPASEMLFQGDLEVSIRSHKTGQHVTLSVRAKTVNEGGWPRWKQADFETASHVFVNGPGRERIATYWPDERKLTEARDADPVRFAAAKAFLQHMAGDLPQLAEQADIIVSARCGRCGTELTDPKSVERGFGPDCYGMVTGSRHVAPAKLPEAERTVEQVDRELDAAIATVNELQREVSLKPEFGGAEGPERKRAQRELAEANWQARLLEKEMVQLSERAEDERAARAKMERDQALGIA